MLWNYKIRKITKMYFLWCHHHLNVLIAIWKGVTILKEHFTDWKFSSNSDQKYFILYFQNAIKVYICCRRNYVSAEIETQFGLGEVSNTYIKY